MWERMLSPGNLGRALRRVEANRGAPGVDGMTKGPLRPWLHEHWASVREALDAGTYQTLPVRRVVIPKPGGGERLLGVPACLDRLIEQAIAQVLTPIFDPGSPLSPILPDIMLDHLDRQLGERGHRFVRYADDLRVFVRSERAARRVIDSVCDVIERRLRLKVNREKSSIRHAALATLLGFGFFLNGPQVTIQVAPQAIKRLKDRLRRLTRRSWGVSMAYRISRLNQFITGWMAYFRLADAERTFGSLDGWLRRRLRQVRWKEWKTTAAKRHNLRIRGISESNARKWGGSSKGCWRVAGSKVLQVSLPNSYWNRLGLKTLSQTWQRLNPTA